MRRTIMVAVAAVLILIVGEACDSSSGGDPSPAAAPSTGPAAGSTPPGGSTAACELVESGWGNPGTIPLQAEKVVSGLEVPWAVGFLPGGDWLVTERPGRVRLVRGGTLVPNPVLTVTVGEDGEGGLLGLAVDPDFASNRRFFIYYTTTKNGASINRVERYVLSEDHAQAQSDRMILDDVPAGSFHDGGRLRIGPDGDLYIGVGDGREPDRAQDPAVPNGKILRVDRDGGIPADNPTPGSAVYVSGVRNPEAFDWVNPGLMILADHGPTGELGLTGLDEVSFATAGANLGWPKITGCGEAAGLVTPILSWKEAAPPGGGTIYRGSAIPELQGSFLVGMLGIGDGTARQLHRIVFDAQKRALVTHEIYLENAFGRLRDVVESPDGQLYVTTSNCDSRGTCPADKDAILKVTRR